MVQRLRVNNLGLRVGSFGFRLRLEGLVCGLGFRLQSECSVQGLWCMI